MQKHGHYFKDVSNLRSVDVYRVLDLFGVTDPCLQHAAKKLLCAGARGAKDQAKDIGEAIDSLNRWQEMRAEDADTVARMHSKAEAEQGLINALAKHGLGSEQVSAALLRLNAALLNAD